MGGIRAELKFRRMVLGVGFGRTHEHEAFSCLLPLFDRIGMRRYRHRASSILRPTSANPYSDNLGASE